ncbi:DUF5305 domain-containing protein [Natrialbaceae archaeon GCM10025810]|uniref:DUF5305 domain-containing protein n=1 Tax=Halovalidus salilacus TaxID=3075124 RepID=UPI003612115C
MTSNAGRFLIRTRVILDEWFVIVVAALLTLSLLGGVGVYTSFGAEQTAAEAEEPTESWSTTGGFTHHAVVQEENDVFDVGTALTDRSTYFTTISPELEGEFQYAYEASDGDVTIDIELEQVVRSVNEEGTGEYWIVNETLETTTAENAGPNDEQTASFSMDVPATVNETEQIEESLGASPGTVETVVVADVAITGTVNGDSIERTEVYELAIEPDGDIYHVDESTEQDEESSGPSDPVDASTTSAPRSSGVLEPVSSTLILLVSLGALGVLAVAKRRGTLAPSDADLETFRLRAEREEFDDWISRGSLPDDLRDRSRIDVETLEDFVDIAIDCDRRVIADDEAFYVVDGDLLYHYDPER